MPFDAVTLAAVADEMREKLLGGRIQAVFLPAPLAVGLEIYAHRQTHYLFASAHPQHARIHIAQGKLSRGSEEVSPLLLLLRKYVRDGRLTAVEQPPLERALALIIAKADVFDKRADHDLDSDIGDRPPPSLTTVTLIVEVMGRYSNIILVGGDGLVMEAVKHIPAEINRYRVTLPHHAYVPPPPQDKADPLGAGPDVLARVLAAGSDQPAWQALVRAFRGVSPLLAREAVFRATGSTDTSSAAAPQQAVSAALAELLAPTYTHAWEPTVAREQDTILDFAPYRLTQFGERCQAVESISAAVHAYFAQETVASDYAGLKQEVGRLLTAQRARVIRRKESLEAQQAVAAEAESLRVKGELLLGYASQIPRGQKEAVLQAAPDQPPLHIALDPQRSAVENAQDYFKRYAQARDAGRSLPPLLEAAQRDLAYLDQLALDLEMAKTPGDIQEVRRALDAVSGRPEAPQDKKRPAPKGTPASPPLTYTSPDGLDIVVGRNARQNDYVTFELASPSDLWLHARGVPGSHVIVRTAGRPAPQRTIEMAASIAAYYSAARTSTTVTVDYTLRRDVRRIKGGPPGLVTYVNEKSLQVRPALP